MNMLMHVNTDTLTQHTNILTYTHVNTTTLCTQTWPLICSYMDMLTNILTCEQAHTDNLIFTPIQYTHLCKWLHIHSPRNVLVHSLAHKHTYLHSHPHEYTHMDTLILMKMLTHSLPQKHLNNI